VIETCREFLSVLNALIIDTKIGVIIKKVHLLEHINIVKVEVHHLTHHEGPEEEQSYSSALSLTLAVNWGGWSISHPGSFTPKEET
jgi:hypothetical protein